MQPIIQNDTRNAMQVLSTGKLNLYTLFNSLHPGIFLTFSFPFYQECGDTLTTFSKPLTVSKNIATSRHLVVTAGDTTLTYTSEGPGQGGTGFVNSTGSSRRMETPIDNDVHIKQFPSNGSVLPVEKNQNTRMTWEDMLSLCMYRIILDSSVFIVQHLLAPQMLWGSMSNLNIVK